VLQAKYQGRSTVDVRFACLAGDKELMHSHPTNAVYVIEGAKLRMTTPDGKSTDVELKTGDTLWREPVTHAAENIGKTTFHAIIIELKKP
jgi:hypothetical protein